MVMTYDWCAKYALATDSSVIFTSTDGPDARWSWLLLPMQNGEGVGSVTVLPNVDCRVPYEDWGEVGYAWCYSGILLGLVSSLEASAMVMGFDFE